MNVLEKFIEDENRWISIFAGSRNAPAPVVMPTNREECEPLFETLEGKLSPENLACDGEASPAHVRKEGKRLRAVWAKLETIRGSKREEWEGFNF